MNVVPFPNQLELFAREANEQHRLCVQTEHESTKHAIASGEALLGAKDLLAHGDFLPWVEEKFEGSRTTAWRYMGLARNVSRVEHLPLSEAYNEISSTAHLSSAKDEWATPAALFKALDAEFHFTLDVCASSENAKCERYFSEAALEQDWSGDVCWMNPPYSEIEAWMAKAASSNTTVVCLVPSRTDVGWFWNYARLGEVRFLRGRLHFVDDEGNTGPAPFPSCLVVFGQGQGLGWYDN